MRSAHRAAWLVFWNKIRVFRWFANANSLRRTTWDAAALVQQLADLAGAANLWRTEGLGYYLVATATQRNESWPRLDSLELRPASLVALHLGVGMALAMKLLEEIDGSQSDETVVRDLEHFWGVCQGCALPESARAVAEPLGFVAVNYYPERICLLNDLMPNVEARLRDFFWHGVGRGLYFSPGCFFPYRNLGRQAMHAATQLTTDERSRANCLAGLSFATTLVNIWHPRHIELFLAYYCQFFEDRRAAASGIASAARVWSSWSGTDVDAVCICQHRAGAWLSDREWESVVRQPIRQAIEDGVAKRPLAGQIERLICVT